LNDIEKNKREDWKIERKSVGTQLSGFGQESDALDGADAGRASN